MTDADRDAAFSQVTTLRDGTPVTIRVMRPDDRDRIVAAFNKLEPGSIYTRFFSYRKEIPDATFERIKEIDFVRLAGLVATVGAGADETVIGSATYVGIPAPDGAKAAEVAFVIEEDYQGQRLASKMLAALTGLARRHGITRFEAEVLAGNAAMLGVFLRCGLPLRRRSEDGVVHVELDLASAAN